MAFRGRNAAQLRIIAGAYHAISCQGEQLLVHNAALIRPMPGSRHVQEKTTADLLMRHSHILNLNGRNPLPSRLDDILDSVCDAHEAQGVNAGHVPCAEPALPIYCWGRGLQAAHIFYASNV